MNIDYIEKISKAGITLFSSDVLEMCALIRKQEAEIASMAQLHVVSAAAEGAKEVAPVAVSEGGTLRWMTGRKIMDCELYAAPQQHAQAALSDEQIEAIYLANGFTIKEGHAGLKAYVFRAARAILAASHQPAAAPNEPIGEIINSGGNSGSLPPKPFAVWFNRMPPIGTVLYAAAPAIQQEGAALVPVAVVQGSDVVIGQESRRLGWVKDAKPFDFEPGTKLYALAQLPAQPKPPADAAPAVAVRPWPEKFKETYPNFPIERLRPQDRITWLEKHIADLEAAAVQQGSERDAALGQAAIPAAENLAKLFGDEAAVSTVKTYGAARYQQGRAAGIGEAIKEVGALANPQGAERHEADDPLMFDGWESGQTDALFVIRKLAAKPPTPPAAADSLETSELDALPYDGKERA